MNIKKIIGILVLILFGMLINSVFSNKKVEQTTVNPEIVNTTVKEAEIKETENNIVSNADWKVYREQFIKGALSEDPNCYKYASCVIDYMEDNYGRQDTINYAVRYEETGELPYALKEAAGECLIYLE